jgi:hypothetical protein
VRHLFLLRSAGLFALFTFALGCGKNPEPKSLLKDVSGVAVSGQLVQNGKPLKLAKDETIHVSFVSTTDDKVASSSEFNPADSTFVTKGPTGKGLPPGKYKVGLASDRMDGGVDRFQDSLDTASSPLTADIGSEEGQTFIIDVAAKTVTKKK